MSEIFMFCVFCVSFLSNNVIALNVTKENMTYSYFELEEHTVVTESNIFPYVVAILKKSAYLSAGALISDNWVLTAADALYTMREAVRVIRVRVGSINYKKGGEVIPIKFFQMHPYFQDTMPEYDIALVMLSRRVRFSPSVSPIRFLQKKKEVTATHYIVTAWPTAAALEKEMNDPKNRRWSMDDINRRRILRVSHLHPADTNKCIEELEALEVNSTDTIMCLEPALESSGCLRDTGAPVVLNGVLWGLVSSYRPEDCDVDEVSTFVTLVGVEPINSWIHSTLKGHQWYFNYPKNFEESTNEDSVDDNRI